ncbi:hypothetical protein [Streptomyces sp. SID10815]|nr:hypothetical protein [Streptomyces sp. SID10815]
MALAAALPLADVLAWKGRLGRQKDQQDIKLIRDHLGHPNV